MKRLAQRLLLFALFAVGFYVLGLVGYGMFAPQSLVKNLKTFDGLGFTSRRLTEVDTVKSIDLLVVGSSHAYRGYDTRIFKKAGINTFNLGSNAQSPRQSKYLLDRYVERLKPKFVIIDVYPVLFKTDGVESQQDLVAAGMFDDEIVNTAFELNDIRLYNNVLFGGLLHLFNAKQKIGTAVGDEKGTYIQGGYIESYDWSKDVMRTRHKRRLPISENQVLALKAMVDHLKSKQIPFIIVQSPFSKLNYNSYTNNDEFDKLFSSMGEYYNFNKIVNLTDRMCFDDSHLNQLGANVFNTKLIEIFKRRGYLAYADR